MTAFLCPHCGSDRWTSDWADPPVRCVQCGRQPISDDDEAEDKPEVEE